MMRQNRKPARLDEKIQEKQKINAKHDKLTGQKYNDKLTGKKYIHVKFFEFLRIHKKCVPPAPQCHCDQQKPLAQNRGLIIEKCHRPDGQRKAAGAGQVSETVSVQNGWFEAEKSRRKGN